MIYGGILSSIDYLLIYNDIFQSPLTHYSNYTIHQNERIDANSIYYFSLPFYIDICQPGYIYTYFDRLYIYIYLYIRFF